MNLTTAHPALTEKRSIHPKRVFDAGDYKSKIFKPAALNNKLGNGNNIITKGKWIMLPMFYLTLEERATCPTDCHHWRGCYGNNMAFSHRFKPGKNLEDRLSEELEILSKKNQKGFVIRLHVLGDFYSKEYVQFWINSLQKYPNLNVFGYTARHDCEIGKLVSVMNTKFPRRSKIRQSFKSNTEKEFTALETPNYNSITCPQQTGKTDSCTTCSLCWEINRPIHFLSH